MRAFAHLDTCRSIGMDVGPIPWTAIDLYAERRNLRGRAREVFEVCIATMDRAYLAEERAKAPPQGVSHAR